LLGRQEVRGSNPLRSTRISAGQEPERPRAVSRPSADPVDIPAQLSLRGDDLDGELYWPFDESNRTS
jgi:hypothetical protein